MNGKRNLAGGQPASDRKGTCDFEVLAMHGGLVGNEMGIMDSSDDLMFSEVIHETFPIALHIQGEQMIYVTFLSNGRSQN